MKKSLIALAVAGVVSAPAFAATSNVDIYGVMSVSVDWIDTNDAAADGSDIVTGADKVSRIGFKGSEDLGGGMKAVWQLEEQINTGGAFAHRNTFVGLAGGFGTVLMGRHDTPYKLATGKLDPFADSIGDYNAIIGQTDALGNTYDNRAAGTVAYISPTFSGFHAAVAYVGAKNAETAGQDNAEAWSLMGMYDNGPIFASLAYEAFSGAAGAGSTTTTGTDAMKLGLGYTFGATKLGLVYETISDDAVASNVERDAWYVSLSHAMGPITLKAAYGKADDAKSAPVDEGATFMALGVDYNMSKRTTVYAVYADLGNDTNANFDLGYSGGTAASAAGNDISGFSIGIKHSF